MDSRFVPLPRAVGPIGHTPTPTITPTGLAAFTRALERCDTRLRGFVLLQDGAVTAERYWAPYRPEDMVWVYSISKSFTSTAVGFACAEGLLDVEDRIVDLFPDKLPAEISPHLAELRLRHLLAMSTGHAEDTAPPLVMSAEPDWERVFFSLPIEHEPGTFFCYNSGASFMLAAAVQRATGEGLVEYLTPRLFEPLGFDRVAWDRTPSGVAMGGWGFMLRLEDLAKLGELYRSGGAWNGTQILDPAWVREATRLHTDNSQRVEPNIDWTQGYGYQFWMCRHGAYRADGAFGQYCIVFPAQRAVLALYSEAVDMQPTLDAVWDTLLPELDRLPGEPAEPRAYTLSEPTHGFDTVAFGIDADGVLALTFTGPDGDASLRAGDGTWEESRSAWPFGAWTALPSFSLSAAEREMSAHYRRTAPGTYEVEWVWRQSPHRNRVIIAVGQEGITITFPAAPHGEQMGIASLARSGARVG